MKNTILSMKSLIYLALMLALGQGAWAQGGPVEIYKLPSEKEHWISPTKYDYSRVAEQLTEGCQSNLEKIEAIYDWMTRTIAYDTSYSVRTADGCFDAKKGVCQGYSELFYRIAEAAGLRVEIISGISRDIYGRVSDSGHAWLFAYTRENYGILIDPTWDAGTVNGNEFKRGSYHRGWFGVDPKWMILTHFPKEEEYQLLSDSMSEEEFRSLNYEFSLQYIYGFDVETIYTRARNHTLSMPKFYSGAAGDLIVLEAPLQAEFQVGESYFFRIRMMADKELILVGDNWYSNLKEGWTDEGDGVYSITYKPSAPGQVSISLRERGSAGQASVHIVYTVKS